jgi:DNA-binding XRE family transcriptional regulator
MISSAQLRAARALVDWTRNDLAKLAGVSPETIKNIEHNIFRPQEETSLKLERAFTMHSVEFTENDGVRLRKDSVIRFEGVDGFKKFMDDVYNVAVGVSKSNTSDEYPICLSCSDDGLFTKFLGEYFDQHARRMNELSKIKVKILMKDKPSFKLPEETVKNSYREYRWFTEQHVGNVPFYVYGDKLGILIFEKDNVSIVVISSAPVAKAYREQFAVLWNSSKPLDRVHDPRNKSNKKFSEG